MKWRHTSGFSDHNEVLITDENEEFDFFSDSNENSKPEDKNKYWFMDHRLQIIENVHDYLEDREETGKVVSLGTFLKIGRQLDRVRFWVRIIQ